MHVMSRIVGYQTIGTRNLPLSHVGVHLTNHAFGRMVGLSHTSRLEPCARSCAAHSVTVAFRGTHRALVPRDRVHLGDPGDESTKCVLNRVTHINTQLRVLHHTSLAMEPPSSAVWIILVDNKFRAMGRRFQIPITSVDDVDDLKKKVGKKRLYTFARERVDHPNSNVLRPKGRFVINNSNSTDLKHTLTQIKTEQDTTEWLCEDLEVAQLQLSADETLVVQLPVDTHGSYDTTRDEHSAGEPITVQEGQEYEVVFLRAHHQGNFMDSDVRLNQIESNGTTVVPEFVVNFEWCLSRRRKISHVSIDEPVGKALAR
ncbi:hypothetical protein EI94DRAFT_888504 [Lactarius quietus]|nr:hypothetical protein EI94DRAFT_888504 [Lactarius quietus]